MQNQNNRDSSYYNDDICDFLGPQRFYDIMPLEKIIDAKAQVVEFDVTYPNMHSDTEPAEGWDIILVDDWFPERASYQDPWHLGGYYGYTWLKCEKVSYGKGRTGVKFTVSPNDSGRKRGIRFYIWWTSFNKYSNREQILSSKGNYIYQTKE